jgi:hypothetical protein
MGLYNFKKRFAPFVKDGSKTHTIRAKRKHRAKVGETLHLYTGLRTKNTELLRRSPCVRVEDIIVTRDQEVFVQGVRLSADECSRLAYRDGFRSSDEAHAFEEMMSFWEGRLPFNGDIIHWKD